MDVIKHKTDSQLIQSLIAEVAKATNEIKCAQNDIRKAQSRLSFVLLLVNELSDRNTD